MWRSACKHVKQNNMSAISYTVVWFIYYILVRHILLQQLWSKDPAKQADTSNEDTAVSSEQEHISKKISNIPNKNAADSCENVGIPSKSAEVPQKPGRVGQLAAVFEKAMPGNDLPILSTTKPKEANNNEKIPTSRPVSIWIVYDYVTLETRLPQFK